jgi:hypothetical protein
VVAGNKIGDIVFVKVDPRSNNGSDQAAALVVGVSEGDDEERVNVRVFLDGDGVTLRRNVPVLSSAPGEDDEDAPSVYALSEPSEKEDSDEATSSESSETKESGNERSAES